MLPSALFAPEGPGSSPTSSPAASAPAAAPAAPTSPSPSPSGPGTSQPSGGAPSSAPPSQGDRLGIDPEIQAIFGFDPHAPEPTDPAQVPAGGPTPSTPVPQAPGTQPAAAPQAPTAPVAQTPEQELATLRLQVQALAQRLSQPPAGAAAPAAPMQEEALPPYNFTIPEQLLPMLRSEDPNEVRTGLGHLLRGAAQGIHRTIVDSMRREISAVLPRFVNGIVQQQAMQQSIFHDFYANAPDLNRPELRSLVMEVGQQVAQEVGAQGWSEQLRNLIAQRVRAVIQGAIPQPQAAPVPNGSAPPAIMPSLSRPSMGPPQNEQERHMLDMLRN